MALFLSGGWDAEQTKVLDDAFKAELKGKNILYIPWAMFPERYLSCLEWVKTVFPEYEGFQVYLFDEQKLDAVRYEDFDALYIGWGNTYRLLNLIRKTWFDQIIEQFAEEKLVYGGSAGALILSKTIDSCADLNLYGQSWSQLDGLNLIGWYGVFCHYKSSKSTEECLEFTNNHPGKYLALPEGAGLRAEEDRVEVIGDDSIDIFEMWKKYAM